MAIRYVLAWNFYSYFKTIRKYILNKDDFVNEKFFIILLH